MRPHPTASRLIAAMAIVSLAVPVAAQYVTVPEFPLGQTAGWRIFASDVAVGSNGAIVAVWQQTEDTVHGPKARALVASHRASPAAASEQSTVLEPTFDEVLHPRVAAIDGGYFVAWAAGESELRATVLDEHGTPRRADLRASDNDGDKTFGRGPAIARVAVGAALVWWEFNFGIAEMRGRLFDGAGSARGDSFLLDDDVAYAPTIPPFVDAASLADGGFVVVYGAGADEPVKSHGRSYYASGLARGPAFELSLLTHARAVAASPDGGTIVVVGVRSPDSSTAREVWARHYTVAGVPLGPEFLVHAGRYDLDTNPSVEFDPGGNLYVVWSERYPPAVRARGFDASGAALGPAVQLGVPTISEVRSAALPDGTFLNAWNHSPSTTVDATVVSLCTPGTSVCGDGTLDAVCERCDDGAANSDDAPDACRTTCRRAGCGDGVIDTGESCDDGNRDDCDGCDVSCGIEAGFGCGDGLPYPACGELCDDANLVVGDGCSPGCVLERIPGGGSAATDCHTEWSIENAANVPLLVAGEFGSTQVCTEGDPRCDFDADSTRCTFHLRVCVNNTSDAACTPSSRLAAWTLKKPSAGQAATHPDVAVARAALLGTVPATIVGPGTRDLCTAAVDVPIALRGATGRLRSGKLALKTIATLYDGTKDTDGLKLVCLPSAP